MKAVFSSYLQEPPELPRALERPKRWTRRSLEWRDDGPLQPVYVAPIVVGTDGPVLCHLYGARHLLSETTIEGYPASANFVEYIAFVPESSGIHRLVQDEASPAFTEPGGPIEVVDAADIDVHTSSDRQVPNWRSRDEAWWPLLSGQPMQFAGEVDLPKNEVTERLLTFDKRVRLFYTRNTNVFTFAILHSSVKAQTAEEHYADEALRALWN